LLAQNWPGNRVGKGNKERNPFDYLNYMSPGKKEKRTFRRGGILAILIDRGALTREGDYRRDH